MEHMTNKVDRESLKPGDHIYAYRKLLSYSHHDRVIHYNRTGEGHTSRRAKPCRNCGVDKNHLQGVVKTCVDCFLRHHFLRRYRYSVSNVRYLTNRPGTCTTGHAQKPEVTISRANDLWRDGFGDYNLIANNCETFAVFCKTGKRVSDQARTAILVMKGAMDRLLGDVLVHHGEEKHDKLKQRIDVWLAEMPSLKEVIDNLQKDDKESHQLKITGA